MSTSSLMQSIKAARRDALVCNYIARYVPSNLQDKVTNEDDLYEYLLLDTKISDLVETSPVSEAISSLQLYINRCIEGNEGTLTTNGNSNFATGKFLYNWDTYNKRYSTWAGKERLKYYAGSYIDPTLRHGKTELFQNFEQNISQGRLAEEIVSNALRDYLTEYEVLTGLDSISVNTGRDKNILIFIGRSATTPYEYYWRRLNLKEDESKKLIPDQWSGWKKIFVSIIDAKDNMVVPYWNNNRLHVQWISTEIIQEGESSANKLYLNDWILNSSGIWREYRKLSERTSAFELVDTFNIDPKSVSATKNQMICNVPQQFNATIDYVGINSVNVKVKNQNPKAYYISVPGRTSTAQLNDSYANQDTLNIGSTYYAGVMDEKREYLSYISFRYHGSPELQLPNLYGEIINNQYFPPAGSSIQSQFNLAIDRDIDLSFLLEKNLELIFNYDIQSGDQLGGENGFFGPYGIYIWEIFFHIPFLVAVRFNTEQRFELAAKWLKFIFDSAGYRDEDGNLQKDNSGNIRYWNVVPLQEDIKWDNTLSFSTVDPDEIALSDPMQYKLAVFIHTLDFLIGHGDHYYRMLERDTMVEAKMYYMQAFQLLGSRPEIRISDSWPDPTLSSEANAISVEPTSAETQMATPLQSLRTFLRNENGNFLPPYNYDFLALWDKIELRLYNLRHNLSLDGQPLSISIFTEPVSPGEIHKTYSAGDGLERDASSAVATQNVYRFPTLIDKARSAVNAVSQFGNSLQSVLEKQDAEAMTLLMQTQQQTVLQQAWSAQEKNLESLQESLKATQAAKRGVEMRKDEYKGLLENWISENETSALSRRTNARILNISSNVPLILGGALDLLPNIFGMANGGMNFGAASNAIAQTLQINATAADQSAEIMDISESYRRRREDWQIQYNIADNEVAQLESQIASQQEQISMAQKQLSLAEMEQAHMQAVYELQRTRFTSQTLYNWMAGRLSSLYYQLYDATLPVCLMAKSSLEKELGSNKATGTFTTPAWNDLYQGLLAGEILMAELQKLDNLWLEENVRGWEAIKTVSLDNMISADTEMTFSVILQELLSGKTPASVNGVSVKLENGIFMATLDLSKVGLASSYNQTEKARSIKNLSVTLPTLLGPYQDIEATLALGNEVVALSHGMNDSGLFITDLDDNRFLPFEGMNPTTGTLILSIFQVGNDGRQQEILKNLNDIIFHIRYIIR